MALTSSWGHTVTHTRAHPKKGFVCMYQAVRRLEFVPLAITQTLLAIPLKRDHSPFRGHPSSTP